MWWVVPWAAPVSPVHSSSLSSLLLLAFLDRDFQQSPGESRDRFWAFLEVGRILRSVAMGTTEQHHWLEDKQAVSLTSD